MDNVTIAKLQKISVVIVNDIVKLFEIYNQFIRPQIKSSNTFIAYQNLTLAKPILFIKTGEVIQLVNNFEVFYLLKTVDLNQELCAEKVSIVKINEAQFEVKYAFYELIDIICRYQKYLDIRLIYIHLNRFLTADINQQLFSSKKFSIGTFCNLINIHEQTYYKRYKKDKNNVNY